MKDPLILPESMIKSIHSHYLTLIRTLKSELALAQSNIPRAISLVTKNKENYPIHPSQGKFSAKDLNNITHPIHHYNNLGVIHLRMKKYALALTFFQAVLH